ncbi:unnamed protein product [Parnassius apollo]|uniref:(apollo) hypothetical protein n=1 Tax=Parnassius apollo TaxID=110799 RepID=A0A8S3Y3M3_PARAO|nr:unnamed protein product [Parnassius apollo]
MYQNFNIENNLMSRSPYKMEGRAVLDRLSSTTLSEVTLTRDAEGLYPVPLDVGTFSVVAANATCGDNGAEEFCRDTPGKRGVVCDVCEGLDGSPSRRHLATFAVDGDPATWWQSPTQASGEEFSHVEFVASLPTQSEIMTEINLNKNVTDTANIKAIP